MGISPCHLPCIFQGEDHYAIGAPKADRLRGRVYICLNCFNDISVRMANNRILFPEGSITLNGDDYGVGIGGRFGQSVCAVDLDRDGYDDLVIGAPLYSEEHGVRIVSSSPLTLGDCGG